MRLKVDDATLDICDEGMGTAIVLLHPFPLSKEIWANTAAALSSRARVIRPDFRGLGQSTGTTGPTLMETLAGDVIGILDALDIERAIIVGNSLGVMVTLALYRMFSERVLGMALICGRTDADDITTVRTRRSLADAVEREGGKLLMDAYLNRMFSPSTHRERPDIVANARAIIERCDPRGAADVLRGMALRLDNHDLLSEIKVPVNVVAGTQDSIIPIEKLRSTSEKIPGARFHAIECGHVPALEAPLELNAILQSLLERVTLRASAS